MKPRIAAILSLSAACLLLAPGAARAADRFHFTDNGLTAGQFDTYLATRHVHGSARSSPITGKGSSLLQQGQIYDTDPRLLVAIAGQESNFGLRVCAANNAWNWFWGGSCTKSPFETYENGIRTLSKIMRRSYLNKGYTTIPLIRRKYCIDKCEDWIRGVNIFYGQLVDLERQESAAQPMPMPMPTPDPDPAPAPAKSPVPKRAEPPPLPPPEWQRQDDAARPSETATTNVSAVVPTPPSAGVSRTRMMIEGAAIGVVLTGLLGGIGFMAFRLISRRHAAT